MDIPDPNLQEQFIQYSEKHLPKYLFKYLRHPLIWNTLNRLLCAEEVLRLTEQLKDQKSTDLLKSLIGYCGLEYECVNSDRIPAEGRILVVANHPLGGADWLLALMCVRNIRSDVRVVINKHVYTLLANMSDLLIPIDTHADSNQETRRTIGECLEREEAVVIFPAGSVSRMTLRGIRDRQWKKGVVHFSRDYNTDILPLYIRGRLRRSFYFYPRRLRRILLLRNLLHATPKGIRLIAGTRISSSELKEEPDLAVAAARLKSAVYQIGKHH